MSSNILEVKNIIKKYGDNIALNNISLKIPKGSIYGLLGPNGAGKTSLIRIMNQITMPDSGSIIFDGEALQPKHVQNIGYMPEERGLYKTMKVGEQVMYLAQMKGMSKQAAKKQLQYWFERLEIGNWWDKKIQELSKGMAQKIQFIVTILHKPKLLIFDEPFSGFDPVNANLIKDEIFFLREQGATIIFSTHRMESVEELCDNIALIHKSHKLIGGNLTEVKKQFRTNSFEIGIIPDNKANLLKELEQRFLITSANFKSLNDDLKFKLELEAEMSPNELLQYLISKGKVKHFVESIPSLNDIFIQTVSE